MPRVHVKLIYQCNHCDLEYANIGSCLVHERQAHMIVCDRAVGTEDINDTVPFSIAHATIAVEDNWSIDSPEEAMEASDEHFMANINLKSSPLRQCASHRQSGKRKSLTMKQKYDIIKAHQSGISYDALAQQYSIARETIRSFKKERAKIFAVVESDALTLLAASMLLRVCA